MNLSPTNLYHYVAVQARLWDPKLQELRDESFENSVLGLGAGQQLLLPSNFAIHMGVIANGKALLRHRRGNTEFYPETWEAGIGKFMRGPSAKTEFPHCKNGLPNLSLFLRNAVAEELGYFEVEDSDFRLYGFAVEYRTLAPKLLVVYDSNKSIEELRDLAIKSDHNALDVKEIDLTVTGLAKAFRDEIRYPSWGPTSKLVLVLALLQARAKEPCDDVDILNQLAEKMMCHISGLPESLSREMLWRLL